MGHPTACPWCVPRVLKRGKPPGGVLGKAGQQEQGTSSGCSGEEGGQGLPQEQAAKGKERAGLAVTGCQKGSAITRLAVATTTHTPNNT